MRSCLRRVTFACALAAVAAVAAQEVRPSSSLAQSLEAYEPGRSGVSPMPRAALWSGASDFRRETSAWVDSGDPAEAPRRRLIVATYVLDMLKDVEDPRIWQDGQAAPALVEWACSEVRKAAPQRAEEAWFIAGIALLERSSTMTVLAAHLERAETRIPSGERWPLVRSLIEQSKLEAHRRDDGTFAVSPGAATRTTQPLERATELASVRQEALLRLGALESDLGRHDAALKRFDRIGSLNDPFLRYWLGLIKGRALQRAGRTQDAAATFRTAVTEFPSAQSGAFSLASALVALRRPSEASAILERALRDEESSTPDPWLTYRTPDVRLWPQALDEIRRAVAK